MVRVVCLANSVRPGGYCFAGIDLDTGEWVRPVSTRADMAITRSMMSTGGEIPRLLDIVDIPLAGPSPDDGCQPENRLFSPGTWRRIGRLTPGDVLAYCEDDAIILHNDRDRVPPGYFQTIPRDEWKSLQLIRNTRVQFEPDHLNPRKWRASFEDGSGRPLALKVTDPLADSIARKYEDTDGDCLLTISLGGPWQPRNESLPMMCYKLVAGVIEV